MSPVCVTAATLANHRGGNELPPLLPPVPARFIVLGERVFIHVKSERKSRVSYGDESKFLFLFPLNFCLLFLLLIYIYH